jgi:NTP pyrophosphatase (non-canonical NTP hydrolase)
MNRLYPRYKFADINTPEDQLFHVAGEVQEALKATNQAENDAEASELDAEIADVEASCQTYWDIRAKQGLDVDAVRRATAEKNKARGYEA